MVSFLNSFFFTTSVVFLDGYIAIFMMSFRAPQVEIMFEKYNFMGFFIQIQAVLTLYAQGM